MQTDVQPQLSTSKAARAKLVMEALGLTPQSDQIPADVDLSAIPKEIIVEVLRDLENALPEPGPELEDDDEPSPLPARKLVKPEKGLAIAGEHPRLAAILLGLQTSQAAARQLQDLPSDFAQKVALDMGRISENERRNVGRLLERAGLWPSAR